MTGQLFRIFPLIVLLGLSACLPAVGGEPWPTPQPFDMSDIVVHWAEKGLVRVQLLDGSGRRAGMDLDTGAILKEIPGSNMIDEYGTSDMPDWFLSLAKPERGMFFLKVKGVKSGTVNLGIDAYDRLYKKISARYSLAVYPRREYEYLIEYSPDPEVSTKISPRE